MEKLDIIKDIAVKNKSAEEWRRFKDLFETYLIATEKSNKEESVKLALLKVLGGRIVLDEYNNSFRETPPRTLKEALETLEKKFNAGESEHYLAHVFWTRAQLQSETIDEWLIDLRKKAQPCKFKEEDRMLRDKIVAGVACSLTRRELLKQKQLTLQETIDICLAMENSATQLRSFQMAGAPRTERTIEEDGSAAPEADTFVLTERRPRFNGRGGPKRYQNNNSWQSRNQASQGYGPQIRCRHCAKGHRPGDANCPARGKQCAVCGKFNHFAAVCSKRQQRVETIDDDQANAESTDEELQLIYAVRSERSRMIYMKCAVRENNGRVTRFQIDSGASCNVVPISQVPQARLNTTIRPTLRVYDKKTLRSLGKTKITLTQLKTGKKHEVEFVVVREELQPILGRFTSEKLGILSVDYSQIDSVTEHMSGAGKESDSEKKIRQLVRLYPGVFDGELGMFPGEVRLAVKPHAVPSCNVSCSVPPHLRSQLKQKLEQLIKREVIERVDHPTQWVNRLSLQVKKNGDLRICLDPRKLNEVLIREVFHTPAFDEILPNLSKVKLFSKFDLSDGFWHCKMDKESSQLTTFQTPFGRFRFLRMPFGLSVAPEIFYKNLVHLLEGLEGTHALADDVLVCGRGETLEEAERDHDRNLSRFLRRCQEKGIKLNKEKTTLKTPDTKFFGFILTERGLQIDPEKQKRLAHMRAPRDVVGLKSFLGMLAHISRFLPDLAQVLGPLRELCRSGREWEWGAPQKDAFERATTMVSRSPILAFFDVEKEVEIECDASKDGLGAALIQEGRPVYFASRAMSPTETRYAQIEKELLAIKYAVNRFRYFIYPKLVTVYTDHRPLINIVKKPLDDVPLRLQRMLLDIQRYNAKLVYRPGREMKFADALSRCPMEASPRIQEEIRIVRLLPMRDLTVELLREQARESEEYRQLIETVRQGWPESKRKLKPAVAELYAYRARLTVEDDLVLCGDTIVVPRNLRKEFIRRSCYAHMSAAATWQRARSCIFWPRMKQDIEQHILQCPGCQTYPNAPKKEPMVPHEIPTRPWQKVGLDIAALKNQKILVVVDYYSNLVIAMPLPDRPTSTSIVRRIKQLFMMFGLCEVMMTDADPLFRSTEFLQFVREWNFRHDMSSPHYHQSHGKAEAAVAIIKRIIRRAGAAKEEWERGVIAYNDTPQEKLGGATPSQMFHSRRFKTDLPVRPRLLQPEIKTHRYAIRARRQHLERMKRSYDRGANELMPLRCGEAVRVRPTRLGVTEWTHGRVLKALPHRRYLVQLDNGVTCYRNRRHLVKESQTEQQTDAPIQSEMVERKKDNSQSLVTFWDLIEPGTDSPNSRSEGETFKAQQDSDQHDPRVEETSTEGSSEVTTTAEQEPKRRHAETEELTANEGTEVAESDAGKGRQLRDRSALQKPQRYQATGSKDCIQS
ncbi:uncharacterized protein K02A2.6-like [Galendromus occidentalis]|uniref:RNA-directed DNA polymerase n=1 Tax=Galendromus occidentalis TaxID=34638 RepID=A0AAJ7PA29_9ACAR|nr:uncharacterized protein K02A2.6-like [Galendromus occidentalis]